MKATRIVLIAVLAALLIAAPAAAQPETATPCAPPATGQPIIVSGTAQTQSAPFELTSNSYRVDWTYDRPTTALSSIQLEPAEALPGESSLQTSLREQVILNAASGQADTAGQTYVYRVKPGRYFLNVRAPAGWQVTLTPIAA